MTNKSPTIFSDYGSALDFVLTELGIEQRWLAQKLEIGDDQVSNYVKNKTTPRKGRRRAIEKLLATDFTQQQDGWAVKIDHRVKKTVSSFNSLAEKSSQLNGSYKAEQDQDDLAQTLELVEQLVHRCRKILDSEKKG